MGLTEALKGGGICIDTQIIIYIIEKHPLFAPRLRPLAVAIQSGEIEVWASELALMESLVLPIRLGDELLVSRFLSFFDRSKLRLAPVSREVLEEAARLRAVVPKLRTPDAIHAATALLAVPKLFLTNDPVFSKVSGLKTVLLSEFI